MPLEKSFRQCWEIVKRPSIFYRLYNEFATGTTSEKATWIQKDCQEMAPLMAEVHFHLVSSEVIRVTSTRRVSFTDAIANLGKNEVINYYLAHN